jgi:hypothetical protein
MWTADLSIKTIYKYKRYMYCTHNVFFLSIIVTCMFVYIHTVVYMVTMNVKTYEAVTRTAVLVKMMKMMDTVI